jgi:hypothetical protein
MYLPRALRNALGFSVLLLLVACGGGSGMDSGMSSSTSGVTAQDQADAQAAKLSASLDPSTRVATLTWSDTFPAGTHYAIEQLGTADSWAQVDSLPGLGGGGASLSWSRTTNVNTTFRVTAMQGGAAVPLDTPGRATSVQVIVPATAPTIVLDQPQPVTGVVNASIAGGGTYSSVAYYLDLTLVGTSTAAPSYSTAVDTSGLTAGSHQLIARLATGPDSYIELRLTFQVAAAELVVTAGLPPPPNVPPVILVIASSQYGITSVSASLDGHSLGTLTAPNCIVSGVIGALCNPYTYQFPFDPVAAGSGAHTVQVTATDGNGVTVTQAFTVTVSNPPALTLSSPIDGALVNGTLQVQGSFATDKQGATVSLSVTLGDLPVLSTSQSPFAASFSLSGVTPGSYTLTATATDSTGQSTVISREVTVTSSASLVYTPVATLGTGAFILAAGGTYVVYMDASHTTFHLLNGGADTTLPLGPIPSADIDNLLDWSVTSDGIAFADDDSSVYMWPLGGAPQNLSSAAKSTGTDVLVQVHYPWLLWSSSHPTQSSGVGSDELILYNVTSAQQFDVHAPSGTTFGCYRCDFATVNGNLALFYWTYSPTLNVFRWDQASNSSVALTSDNQSLYPQTDGVRVAWQTEQGQQTTGPQTLSAQDLVSGTVTVLSTNMAAFSLADGLLAWGEVTVVNDPSPVETAEAIRASDGMTTTTVSNVLGSAFFGSSGGYVVFEESAKLYAWSSGGGRRLLLDSTPGQVHLTGKTVYFTSGSAQTLYAVTLP